jgi:hypothetical protein
VAVQNKSVLSWRQEKAIAALLSQTTIEAAAEAAGVGTRTLERWLAEDQDFRCEFRRARWTLVDETVTHLHKAAYDAVQTLRRNLTAESEAVQVRAARSILDLIFRAAELVDLEGRVAALEEDDESSW